MYLTPFHHPRLIKKGRELNLHNTPYQGHKYYITTLSTSWSLEKVLVREDIRQKAGLLE